LRSQRPHETGRLTQDAAHQAYRVPGVAYDAVRLRDLETNNPNPLTQFRVAGEFIRVVEFRPAGPDGRAYGKQ
jgi:hypothetical protein